MVRWKVFKKDLSFNIYSPNRLDFSENYKSISQVQQEVLHAMDFYLRTGDPNFLVRNTYEGELIRLEK